MVWSQLEVVERKPEGELEDVGRKKPGESVEQKQKASPGALNQKSGDVQWTVEGIEKEPKAVLESVLGAVKELKHGAVL